MSEVEKLISDEPQDYTYFDMKRIETYKGPSHWKIRTRKGTLYLIHCHFLYIFLCTVNNNLLVSLTAGGMWCFCVVCSYLCLINLVSDPDAEKAKRKGKKATKFGKIDLAEFFVRDRAGVAERLKQTVGAFVICVWNLKTI